MDIPAKLVVEKMESELARLKETLDDSSAGSYRDHAQSLKTYCELLLESQHTGTYYKAPPVQHASPEDVRQPQTPAESYKPGAAAEKQPKQRPSFYDEGDKPESDSLLDF
ncbi:YwdI family protein [Alkalicoccus chagannorensis]|uniref:YwdI family protein n=1 Tax=Alkalicoccus chagannorensis TaxID=427072 RepID=UPI0012EB7262|nr:YwdI family protein [Alkalicoccus chagannorensis]